MNQVQRSFLIKKITDASAAKMKELKDTLPECPSISNYLYHAVMKNDFEIRSTEDLKKVLRNKALASKEDTNWLSEQNMGWDKRKSIKLNVEDLFILPTEYKEAYRVYQESRDKIEQEVAQIKIQTDTLITRIQLASDKVLQTMINEVDDMGNISLMDTKLKALNK